MQQLINQVDRLSFQRARKVQLAVCNLLKHFVVKLAVEGNLPHPHLVDDDSERPQISRRPRPILIEHFRGDVKRGTNKRPPRQAQISVCLLKQRVSRFVIFCITSGQVILIHFLILFKLLRFPKVRLYPRLISSIAYQLHMKVPVEQDIIGFQVPVPYIPRMHVFKG